MTREELQQELRKLESEKQQLLRDHETRMYEIAEQQQATLYTLGAKKRSLYAEIAAAKREADAIMRRDNRDEQIRYKTQCITIENKRQQLFADYKAQKGEQA